ncbi:MAG TPA: YbhB/YbcL family Raf kinase inhibitor-like protein, partial [Steroidobacteraceae bacterium]|nr:YbhB/YbcL family Raf kinase inhibitor-like protein [Steroidobacteraceae bacterium]
MALSITSPAFSNGQRIPERYSKDGGNHSPPLEWRDAPRNTRSFALVVEDPDAPRGTFRHWAVYNLPASYQRLDENTRGSGSGASLETAVNDFGNRAYDGPQPPHGHGVHHYHFRLLALDVPELNLPPQAKITDVLNAAHSHVIAQA